MATKKTKVKRQSTAGLTMRGNVLAERVVPGNPPQKERVSDYKTIALELTPDEALNLAQRLIAAARMEQGERDRLPPSRHERWPLHRHGHGNAGGRGLRSGVDIAPRTHEGTAPMENRPSAAGTRERRHASYPVALLRRVLARLERYVKTMREHPEWIEQAMADPEKKPARRRRTKP